MCRLAAETHAWRQSGPQPTPHCDYPVAGQPSIICRYSLHIKFVFPDARDTPTCLTANKPLSFLFTLPGTEFPIGLIVNFFCSGPYFATLQADLLYDFINK